MATKEMAAETHQPRRKASMAAPSVRMVMMVSAFAASSARVGIASRSRSSRAQAIFFQAPHATLGQPGVLRRDDPVSVTCELLVPFGGVVHVLGRPVDTVLSLMSAAGTASLAEEAADVGVGGMVVIASGFAVSRNHPFAVAATNAAFRRASVSVFGPF